MLPFNLAVFFASSRCAHPPRRQTAGADNKDSDEFHNICMSVFESADRDNDGNLNREEFFSGWRGAGAV